MVRSAPGHKRGAAAAAPSPIPSLLSPGVFGSSRAGCWTRGSPGCGTPRALRRWRRRPKNAASGVRPLEKQARKPTKAWLEEEADQQDKCALRTGYNP